MRERGVTLMETLVAMAVMAFGLIAMVRLHLGMGLAADVARSRSEATQHARATMEELRGRGYDALENGSDLPGTPAQTAYLRHWTVDGNADDPVRPVAVTVEWADRRGDMQQVVLRSSIARTEPADAGAALAPGPADPWWRPNGVHHSVPVGIDLQRTSDGRPMALWAGPSAGVLVFDAATGIVVERCAGAPSSHGAHPTACPQTRAVLLMGYIEGPQAGRASVVVDPLAGDSGQAECVVSEVADARSGARMADVRRYQCLVPVAAGDDGAAPASAWSGRIRVAGLPQHTAVCRRLTAGAGAAAASDPGTYTGLDASLDHQNFIISATGVCPDGSVALASTQ